MPTRLAGSLPEKVPTKALAKRMRPLQSLALTMAGTVSMTCARRSELSRSTASRDSSLLASSRARFLARDSSRICCLREFQKVTGPGHEFLMINRALQEIGCARFQRAHSEAAFFVNRDDNDRYIGKTR